jgi:hypothetical protein
MKDFEHAVEEEHLAATSHEAFVNDPLALVVHGGLEEERVVAVLPRLIEP